MTHPNSLPGTELLDMAKSFGQVPASSQPIPVEKPGLKAGGGGSKSIRSQAEAKKKAAEKAWDDAVAGLGEHNPEPVADPVENKPKATLIQIGWMADKTSFQTDAEIFAEFKVPESEKHRTRVDFQLLILEKGDFKTVAEAQGHCDTQGHATAKVPIRKPAGSANTGNAKATFTLKAKHCTGEWSKGNGTERKVTESASNDFSHTQVSGPAFSKDKSFIAPEFLSTFRELESRFKSWRQDHETAKVVVYGHVEKDEEKNEQKGRDLSFRRAEIAFAFLQGDAAAWNRIADTERWGLREQQAVLKSLGHYTGNVDGLDGPKTKQAIKDFIQHANATDGGKRNPQLGFSEASIRQDLYREYIGGPREVLLANKVFREVSGQAFMGCGVLNRCDTKADFAEGNRRVTFLLIAESPNFPVVFPCRKSSSGSCDSEGQKPGERKIAGFRCKFYDELMQESPSGITAVSGALPIEIQLVDAAGKALAQKSYRLVLPDQSEIQGKSDEQGFIRLPGNTLPGEVEMILEDLDV